MRSSTLFLLVVDKEATSLAAFLAATAKDSTVF
jgi:hypothetical protein